MDINHKGMRIIMEKDLSSGRGCLMLHTGRSKWRELIIIVYLKNSH